MIEKWETITVKSQIDLIIFDAIKVERKHPLTGKVSEFVVLDSKNWVNVIPITNKKTVIFVKQYRHGNDSVTLEIPGGLIENNEDSSEAALRECVEETGFTSLESPMLLGEFDPNPAFLNNTCRAYVLNNCIKVAEPNFDDNEVIDVVEIPLIQIPEMIKSGIFRHSISLTSLIYYFIHQNLLKI